MSVCVPRNSECSAIAHSRTSAGPLSVIQMSRLLRRILNNTSRWATREERFLRRLLYGKTVGVRFDGLRRSKRNEAKYFLLAVAPMALIGPFVGKWSDASAFGKATLALLAAWLVMVLVIGGFLLLRSVARASRGQGK